MPNYRRYRLEGGTYFFTVVAERRRPILVDARDLLGQAFRQCRQENPFEVEAIVLLPDHLHCIWTLPEKDSNYSKRWALIKKAFSQQWLEAGGVEQPISEARSRKGYSSVWQPRFWEHTIRNETDLQRHMDYIHYNPVKHGQSKCPHGWQWSSFHRWVRQGRYEPEWGCQCDGQFASQMNFEDIEDRIRE